jgi:asparagine synthase (glutamine-hydrolysing)
LCGIAGFTHKNSVPPPDRIRSAVSSMMHRGPDQQGVFESKFISMGNARLKIIDLNSGGQPMFSDNGDTVIVYNGEIYNHVELRHELEERGHRFHTRCDTEVILRGFLEWDTDCFVRLRGMFAIALWTESTKRLVLARDRMGIKPLYICQKGRDLFFGSELKTILIHPEIDRRLSLNGLDCYLSLNYVPFPWTLVEGIEKLEPGRWLEWQDGEVRSGAYWQLPVQTQSIRDVNEAKQQLNMLLEQSVREHLISDVPLGVWLSGGIDSSTILHYAAKAARRRLKTFSVSFRGRSFDETRYIREVAKQYGTDHEEFDLSVDASLPEAIEEFSYYSDEPSSDAGALPVWFLSKMTRQSATVVLSGEGADELFGGYLTYRANVLAARARRLPSGVLRLISKVLRLLPVSDDKISLEYKLKRFFEGCLMAPERAHVYWNGTFSDDEKRSILQGPQGDALAGILAGLRSQMRDQAVRGDGIAPYLWFDQKYFLTDDILNKTDRMSMAHSIEVRPPFLDHRVVEFAVSLASPLKINGSRQKFLLKQLMAERLPPSVIRRKKIGFDIPAHQWLRGPLRPLLMDAISTGLAEHGGVFREAAIENCMQRHMDRRANLGYHLWGLMTLFLWMRRWRIQTNSAPAMPGPMTETVLTSI